MKNKILPIVFVVMLLLTIGIASATYDLAITNTAYSPTSPVEGVNVDFVTTITNLGPDNFSPSLGDSATIAINYGNALPVTVISINDELVAGDQMDYDSTYNYATNGTYTVITKLSDMNNDNLTTDNNNDTYTIVVAAEVLDVSILDYSLSAFRGDTDDATKSVVNNGNTEVAITFNAGTFTLIGGSDVLSISEVSIDPLSATLAPGASVDLKMSTNPILTRTPGTYEGELQVRQVGGNMLDNSTATIIVKNNAPAIIAIDNQVQIESVEFTYQVLASDVEGETLEYFISGPTSDMVIDSTGLISGWTPAGVQIVNILVTVGDGLSNSTEAFQIEVLQDVARIEIIGDEITMGSNEQNRGEQISQTVTIKNTGTQTISNMSVSLSSSSSTTTIIATTYSASVSMADSSLAPSATTTATIYLTVPETQDAKKENIGRLVVTADGDSLSITDNDYISLEAKSYLKIKEIVVEVGSDDKSLDDGETFDEDDLEEDSQVSFTVTLENLYTEDDFEIEDVYFEVESDESDWDIDDESSKKDIRENDDKDIEVTFVIGTDLDEESTDVVIRVFGDDKENSFEHYDEWIVTFEIEKENDEISIKSWFWTNTPVDCNDNYANLEVTIKNTGLDDQDDVTFEVTSDSSELDYTKRFRNIDLDTDDSKTIALQIPIDGESEGSYFVTLQTYFDGSDESEDEMITLDISACSTGSSSGSSGTTTGNTGGITTTPPTLPPTTTPGTTPFYGESVSATERFTSSAAYLVLLIAIVALLLIIVITMAVRFAIKK